MAEGGGKDEEILNPRSRRRRNRRRRQSRKQESHKAGGKIGREV